MTEIGKGIQTLLIGTSARGKVTVHVVSLRAKKYDGPRQMFDALAASSSLLSCRNAGQPSKAAFFCSATGTASI